MSQNGQDVSGPATGAAVLVVTFPMAVGSGFDRHTHEEHQLAWASSGVLAVGTETASYILPTTRGLWIPAGVPHEVTSAGNATMRALYVKPHTCPIDWPAPTAVAVGRLLAELIGYLDGPDVTGSRRERAEAVLVDLLAPVPTATIDVRMPTGQPARAVAERLLAHPGDRANLPEWGNRVGVSERTLARSFQAETGLTFGRWRTLVRLRAALRVLAEGGAVSTVARQVGYDTSSAFVAAFRRETGLTPGDYFRDAEASNASKVPAERQTAH
jgi:AraC-like DNA-binding protein/quercetin dioxygenase-like cupin family protein